MHSAWISQICAKNATVWCVTDYCLRQWEDWGSVQASTWKALQWANHHSEWTKIASCWEKGSSSESSISDLTCSICNGQFRAIIGIINPQRTHQHTWTPHNQRLRWSFSRMRDEPSQKKNTKNTTNFVYSLKLLYTFPSQILSLFCCNKNLHLYLDRNCVTVCYQFMSLLTLYGFTDL